MQLAQDHHQITRQKFRKYEPQGHATKDTLSQHVLSDSTAIHAYCDDKSASGNESDQDPRCKCGSETPTCQKHHHHQKQPHQSSKKYDPPHYYVSPPGYSSIENEYSDDDGIGKYQHVCDSCCARHRAKQQQQQQHQHQRPHVTRRLSQRGHSRPRPYLNDCEERLHRCGEWCSRYSAEMKPSSPPPKLKPFKNVHRRPECCHHQQKKVLDSYEELPAVDEAMEQRSDATYKASSYTKFDVEAEGRSPPEYDRTPSWMMYGDKVQDTDGVPYGERTIKTRSRRTRMKGNPPIKWETAFIYPVVEESRKEMVGVMVLGQKGPEYYSKQTNQKPWLPFRKSRSFPEDTAKSYDTNFGYDGKDIFFSASDSGRVVRPEPIPPEDDSLVDEKLANIDRNIDELVKSKHETFLRSFARENIDHATNEPAKPEAKPSTTSAPTAAKGAAEKPEAKVRPGVAGSGDGLTTEPSPNHQAEDDKSSVHLMPYELLSSRTPKPTRKFDILAYNVESKTAAETLNEKAKQFRTTNRFDELETKYPPKAVTKETMEANLEFWGMTGDLDLKDVKTEAAGGEGDGGATTELTLSQRRKKEENEEEKIAAMEKVSEEMRRERRRRFGAGKEKLSGTVIAETKTPKGSGDLSAFHEQFKQFIKDGFAISEKESENLGKMLREAQMEVDGTSEVESRSSEDTVGEVKEEAKKTTTVEETVAEDGRKKAQDSVKGDGKTRKRSDDPKLKLIRDALPSIAAENEASHLEELKRHIDRFIVKKIAGSDSRRRKQQRRDTTTTTTTSCSDSNSEVRVDAQKLIDLMSNPSKRITSDMTIDMAKKLTDALVQESAKKSSSLRKGFRGGGSSTKTGRKAAGVGDEASLPPCHTTSGSERDDDVEPTYLEGLKRMRNDHLSNIITEVKRLKELIRFLDRCNKLKL